MYDVLKQLIAEGVVGIFAYPDGDKFGGLRAYIGIDNERDIKVERGADKKAVAIVIANTRYKLDEDFYLDYSIMCKSAEDAKQQRDDFLKEMDSIINYTKKVIEPALAG